VSRDYKPTSQRSNGKSKGKPFITGLLLGLLVGVGLSVGVALFVKKGDSPFTASSPRLEQHKQADPDADTSALPKDEENGKPRFDFYTILPGSESPVTEQEIKQNEEKAEKQAEPAANENYYLQVGAFQTEQEADNMKAKLALLGMEAVVQTATIPDKGIWHRVRVGPFTGLEQINKARSDLARNGFKADLIKVDGKQAD
jgi:cell division protein FtsN